MRRPEKCLFSQTISRKSGTSFHEGKDKKAKPAKTVFLAHKPANFVFVTNSFIEQFLKTTKTFILLNVNTFRARKVTVTFEKRACAARADL